MVKGSLPMSFYVVSVKDRIQESTGKCAAPPYCYQAFSDEIERATDPKADLGPIYRNTDFMQSLYAGEDLLATPLRATKDIVISVNPKVLILILFTLIPDHVSGVEFFFLFNITP
jgi:hypothetical protein